MPSADINDVWAQQTPLGTVENIVLPSGQTVNARKVALQDLILAGVVSETDALAQFVQKHHLTGRNVKPEDAMDVVMGDPKQFGALVMLVDRVVPHIVVDPQVRLHLVDINNPDPKGPKTKMIPVEDRAPGVIYTDQIPLPDKVHLLNWAVGSVAQAIPFRAEPTDAVAAVADGADVPNHTKRPPKNRKRPR